MHDFPGRFADYLEQMAKRVKALTVDRVALWIKLGGLGILAATFALLAVFFLLFAIFGALEIPLTTAGAFAVLGALLVLAGGYMWIKRT
jgi:hypothetical protein